MVKAKRDCINAIVILAFCGFAYYLSLSIPAPSFGKTGGAFFPRIVIGAVAFLSLCYLVSSLLRIKKEKNIHLDLSIPRFLKENSKVIGSFVIFGLYVFALGLLGYIISTILFLFALYMLLAEKKQKFWLVGIGIIVLTLLLFVVFQNILSVFLPTGVFF